MEKRVGQRATNPFLKEDEEQAGFDAFFRKAIRIMRSVPLNQAMGLHLPQVIAQLVQSVPLGREGKTLP